MLADGTCYQDLGADHFVRHDPACAAAKLANRIRNLGFHVEIGRPHDRSRRAGFWIVPQLTALRWRRIQQEGRPRVGALRFLKTCGGAVYQDQANARSISLLRRWVRLVRSSRCARSGWIRSAWLRTHRTTWSCRRDVALSSRSLS